MSNSNNKNTYGKRKVKWLARLIEKITGDCPLNNHIQNYYGRYDCLTTSDTRDWFDVTITDNYTNNTIAEFDFDFWTYELNIQMYSNEYVRETIIRTFKQLYNDIYIKVSR